MSAIRLVATGLLLGGIASLLWMAAERLAAAAPKVPPRLCEGLGADGQGRRILVRGEKRLLLLLRREVVEYAFPAAPGSGGLGKEREGDRKTPLGDYRIKWMVSRRGPLRKNPGAVSSRVVDGITYSVLDTELYFGALATIRVKTLPDGTRAVSSDPADRPISALEIRIARDEKLWTDSYGGRDACVMALDYPNAEDRRAGRTGSSIEIHASVPLLRRGLAKYPGTYGCVALFPADAAKLYERVVAGTPVRIVRD